MNARVLQPGCLPTGTRRLTSTTPAQSLPLRHSARSSSQSPWDPLNPSHSTSLSASPSTSCSLPTPSHSFCHPLPLPHFKRRCSTSKVRASEGGAPSPIPESGDPSKQRARSPRTLTAEERKALGLPALKGQTPPTPPTPRPQSGPSSPQGAPGPPCAPGAPGASGPRAGPAGKRKQWTLLDEMDKEGFGYWAPDETEWGFVKTARNMGDWLLQLTGEPGGSSPKGKAKGDEAGPGYTPLFVLLFVVFPIWMGLTFVAVGKLDLPPALAEFQAHLRS